MILSLATAGEVQLVLDGNRVPAGYTRQVVMSYDHDVDDSLDNYAIGARMVTVTGTVKLVALDAAA